MAFQSTYEMFKFSVGVANVIIAHEIKSKKSKPKQANQVYLISDLCNK